MRVFLDQLVLIIIDEISMISSDQLYKVNELLQEIFISEDFFGGKGLLLVGDLLQLKPVRAKFIFTRPKSRRYTEKFNCLPLWEWFDVIVLEENKRHGKDSKWTQILNRIRLGQHTADDMKVLDSRKIEHFPNVDFKSAVHAFYTNFEVQQYNDEKLTALSTRLYNIKASIKAPYGYSVQFKPHGTIEDTNFLRVLKIKVGSRVKMIYNVDIADNLINGSLGTVTDIITDAQENVTAIIVDFDNPKAGQEQMQRCTSLSGAKGCPVFRIITEFQLPFKDHSKRKHNASAKISQFPLRLSWASTAHGLQGSTVEKGSNMVIHGHKNIPPAMIYVMLGRCQYIDNIFLQNIDYDKIQCEKAALKENSSLEHRSIVSLKLAGTNDIFFVNVRSLDCHFEDLLCDLEAKKSSCICLVETWIEESQNVSFLWPDKNFYHCSKGRGNGCAIFESSNLTNNHPFLKFATDKIQICSLRIHPIFQVILVYISKKCDLNEVVNIIMDITDNLEQGVQPLILGDFNFNATECNAVTKYFAGKQFVQLVHQPTHIEGRIIDHCYVHYNVKELIDLRTLFCYYTDHARLLLKIKS